jgi:hypothetical protein
MTHKIKFYIQGDSRGKVTTLAGHYVGHCEKKKLYMNICLILKCYRD